MSNPNLVDDSYEENMQFLNEVISLEFSSKAEIAAAQLDYIISGFTNLMSGKPPKAHIN